MPAKLSHSTFILRLISEVVACPAFVVEHKEIFEFGLPDETARFIMVAAGR